MWKIRYWHCIMFCLCVCVSACVRTVHGRYNVHLTLLSARQKPYSTACTQWLMKWERMWKAVAVVLGTVEVTQNLSQSSQCPGQDMNQLPPSYKSEMPLLETICSVFRKKYECFRLWQPIWTCSITCHMSDKLLWPVRFELLTVTLLWIQAFWDVTMCSCTSGSLCFKGSVCLNAQSQAVQEKLFFWDWLKMKATRSFWTLRNSNAMTQCHNPQDFYPVEGFYYGCVCRHVKTHKKLLPQWTSLQFTLVQHITSMAYCKQEVCSCQSFRNWQPEKFWNEKLMYDG